jgi:predicted Zn-dependent peptidase
MVVEVFEELFASLFKKHNYGLQTTIGTVEHLKNPSLVIRSYFNKYYVPNNGNHIGDFNPDEVIAKIDKTFGQMRKAIPSILSKTKLL